MEIEVTAERTMKLSFIGKDAAPENIRISQMVEILQAFETAVAATALVGAESLRVEDLGIGLATVEANSIDFGFRAKVISLVLPAFLTIATAINTGNYGEVPGRARESIQKIVKFAHGREYDAVLSIVQGAGETIITQEIARITKETRVVAPRFTRGDTQIYGKLLRVGGVDPKLMLRVGDTTLSVDVSEDLAKSVAERLYQVIGLSGTATWDIETLNITDFKVAAVLPYKMRGFDLVVKEAQEKFGDVFGAIDVAEFMRERHADE